MSHLDRRSNYINQRNDLEYNNGGMVQPGDVVSRNGKSGRIVNFDRQTVNIKYNDGSTETFVPVEQIIKIAARNVAEIVDKVFKDSF